MQVSDANTANFVQVSAMKSCWRNPEMWKPCIGKLKRWASWLQWELSTSEETQTMTGQKNEFIEGTLVSKFPSYGRVVTVSFPIIKPTISCQVYRWEVKRQITGTVREHVNLRVKRWYELCRWFYFRFIACVPFHAQVGRRQWFNMVYRWCDVVWELMLPTGNRRNPPLSGRSWMHISLSAIYVFPAPFCCCVMLCRRTEHQAITCQKTGKL